MTPPNTTQAASAATKSGDPVAAPPDSDTIEGSIIGPVPDLAKKAAEKRLVEALRGVSFTELAADAISKVVVDPTAARHRLQIPAEMRVPGATIRYITVSVWSPLVATYPANAREIEDKVLPIAEKPAPFRPLAYPTSEAEGRPQLALSVESSQQLMYGFRESSRSLLELNDLRSTIGLEGVLMPVILAALTVSHADGQRDIAFLVTVDGSSRVASAHDLTGVDPTAPAYVYPLDDRRFRQLVAEVKALGKRPFASLTAKEKAKVRAVTMPASIIVGIEHDDAGGDTAGAVLSLVGQIHVAHAKEWGEGPVLDAQGDAVIKELHDNGYLTDDERDYIAGLLTRAEAQAAGLPFHHDERSLQILAKAVDHQYLCNRGVKRIVPKDRVNWQDLADIVVELGIRAYRGQLSRIETNTARVALQRIFRRSEFKDAPWQHTGRTPDGLRDAALAEITAAPEKLGASAMELALLAAYWLTRHRILRRPDRQTDDKREPEVVLRAMAMTERGIRVLHRALVDGREGIVPRVVDGDGEVVPTAGDAVAQTDTWLRTDIAPEPVADDVPLPPGRTPEDDLATWRAHFATGVERLSNDIANIRAIRKDGAALVDVLGWPAYSADDHVHVLDGITKDLYRWMMTWNLRNVEDPEGAAAEDVEEEGE